MWLSVSDYNHGSINIFCPSLKTLQIKQSSKNCSIPTLEKLMTKLLLQLIDTSTDTIFNF